MMKYAILENLIEGNFSKFLKKSPFISVPSRKLKIKYKIVEVSEMSILLFFCITNKNKLALIYNSM